MVNLVSARHMLSRCATISAISRNIIGRRISRRRIAGFASRTANHWINGTPGIEFDLRIPALVWFRPYRAGEYLFDPITPGLRFAPARAVTLRTFGPGGKTSCESDHSHR